MTLPDSRYISWFDQFLTETGSYRHSLLLENEEMRVGGIEALVDSVAAAHSDAVRFIEKMTDISLSPFGGPSLIESYPQALHSVTLQGYLGEILAAVFAENFDPHGRTWEVPVFLFRFHNAAIESLDRRLAFPSQPARPIPGRTGDDCVAFQREDGRITAWLNCEAKCSKNHDATLLADGHSQLSRAQIRIASGVHLNAILRDSEDPEADEWISAIKVYMAESQSPNAAERLDLLVYVCGQVPDRNRSWMGQEESHSNYNDQHPFEAVEIHLDDVHDVIVSVYPGHVITIG